MQIQQKRAVWYERFGPTLEQRFPIRSALISPPRTGSTLIARILWSSGIISHHCHEPFEALYWGNGGEETVENILFKPMEVATGARQPLAEIALPQDAGLLLKEMTFQLNAEQFLFMAEVSTTPIIFVVRDPRLAAVSRLRIVGELTGAKTFKPEESGWIALQDQINLCKNHNLPYVIVDSGALRRNSTNILQKLANALGVETLASHWDNKTGLQLCAPEVGILMGDVRAHDDPFYRRVLASTSIQPPDQVDFNAIEKRLTDAGLSDEVKEWLDIYSDVIRDRNILAN